MESGKESRGDKQNLVAKSEVIEGPDFGPPNIEAWSKPGHFHVESCPHGVARIEGWLSVREGARPPSESRLQELSVDDWSHPKQEKENREAGHVIAYSLGGPSVAEHGEDVARANLLPMDSTINRSHYRAVESHVREDLKAGREIYALATIRRDGQGIPTHVDTRFFVKDLEGRPTKYEIAQAVTRIDGVVSHPLRDSVRQFGGQTAADFVSPTRRGTTLGDH